ncbi:MAG: FKBP-type peptidyl-prolyl cis-trans isomerase N-terminal domain-containing protein [Sphaerochaetaceae bacterium]|nr:FKBP-type peptidyl-prolyl cis-trans isomerase N-terminal domain-containing protein [Sphaerochaetaceae bacterium]
MKRLHVLAAVFMCVSCTISLVGCSKTEEPSTPASTTPRSSIDASVSISVSSPAMASSTSNSDAASAGTMLLADFDELPKPAEFGAQMSYVYGYATMASALRILAQGEGVDTNIGYVLKGVLDAGNGRNSFFTDEETRELFSQFQTLLIETLHAKVTELASNNLKLSQEFLARNASAEGVFCTPSGLQYKVLTEGTGFRPHVNDTVSVDYQITLLNGTVIDSTYIRGSSDTLNISWLAVEGFKEGLQLMPVGSKYRFWISPDLGYGVSGGSIIEPNSLLIVDVELKAIIN